MNRSQADRSVVAARAALRPVRTSTEPVSRNLALRGPALPTATGVSPRKGKTRKAWSHSDIRGKRSEWHNNPFYYSPIEVDRRWSK